ncbi:MAG: FAD-dependent monooxygenase [Acidobacteriota bacterium]
MSRPEFDAIIVGASIAGSSAAIRLAQRGFRILLLDRAVFPRDKVCGEGMMPAGVEILSEMGLQQELKRLGAVFFQGIRFLLPGGPHFEIPFSRLSSGLQGCAIPRSRLDNLLACRASRQGGVTFLQGWTVQSAAAGAAAVQVVARCNGRAERFQGRLLIGADGIRSRWPRRFGIGAYPSRYRRFALRARFAEYCGDTSRVDVHTTPGGEAYVAPQADGGALLTLLLPAPGRNLGGASADTFLRFLKGFPRLLALIPPGCPPQNVQSTAPLGKRLDCCHGHRLILLGDAAGAVDPVTGQGMTLALRDAQLAAEILKERLREDRLQSADLVDYTRLRNRYFLPAYQFAEGLLLALQYPSVARRIARSLTRNPRLRGKLLALQADSAPPQPVTWLDKLRLLSGI